MRGTTEMPNLNTFNFKIYNEKTHNVLDLTNPNHRQHVFATMGYHEEIATRSRVITFMRILGEKTNFALANNDHYIRGTINGLILALSYDDVNIEIILENGNKDFFTMFDEDENFFMNFYKMLESGADIKICI